MKQGKAVGPDELSVEVWKCMGKMERKFLTRLFNRLLMGELMPEEWILSFHPAHSDGFSTKWLLLASTKIHQKVANLKLNIALFLNGSTMVVAPCNYALN